MFLDCNKQLEKLNNAYGKGDIDSIHYITSNYGYVCRILQYGRDIREFYIKDGKLSFIGHMMKVI
jgi:hypothetical protein